MPLELRVAFKPTPSIGKKQQTVDLKEMKEVDITIHGRHDSCIVPRAVVVVESMVAITLCDFAIRAGIIEGVLR
jgi:chorismate synthase